MASPRSLTLAFALLIFGSEAHANSYIVTNTSSSGAGSLHVALSSAASNAGPDTVRFNVPGTGIHSIVSYNIADSYGISGDDTFVDGYTQPGSSANTAKLGQPSNAVITIYLQTIISCEEDYWDYYPGFDVGGHRNVVRGIRIDNFCNDIIVTGEDNAIEGCYLDGADTGILVLGAKRARIGGTTTASRNVVIGNLNGIYVHGGSSDYPCVDNVIEGNYIDSNSRGLVVNGITSGTIVGGHAVGPCALPPAANFIRYSYWDGISILGAEAIGTTILSNVIHSNGGLGIDIGDDGVTPNDNVDADAGPNMTQNYPVIQSAHGTVISGILSSERYKIYTIQVFDNSSCDPVAGEGKLLFGETQVTTADDGIAHFAISCAAILPGRFYTATATDQNGNTSEFSPCFAPVITAAGDTPSRSALHGNVPNPFNPITSIAYEVGAQGHVDIVIFHAAGRRIRTLVAENRNIGSWTTTWDGRDEAGKNVASGVYFCRMNAQGFESTQKMVLLK